MMHEGLHGLGFWGTRSTRLVIMEAADDLRELDRQIESHREYDHLSANQLMRSRKTKVSLLRN